MVIRYSGMGWLEQVPFVVVEVFEDGDGAVRLRARRFEKTNTVGQHGGVVAAKVVCMKEKKDAAAGLVTDTCSLLRRCGASE